MQAPLLLASTSAYRAERLACLQIPFEQASPVCDETPQKGESPSDLALRLARQKAASLATSHPHHLIIGSDQTAAAPDGQLLSKPGTAGQAIDQLERCSGRTVVFHTAVAFAGISDQSWDVTTEVCFRDLTRPEIERYIAKDQPMDCAGSFKVEALGITLFDWVRSDDPNALIGLPLLSLAKHLRALGYLLP